MKSVTGKLIMKDWQLYRWQVVCCIAAGAIALAITLRGSEPAMVVGGVWFFIALAVVGTMLPLMGIANERKKHNLAFLMSLPISPIQYTKSKLVSILGIFLVPWTALVVAALSLIEIRGLAPRGTIPLTLILAMFPFVGMCLITAATLIGESEGWGIAANLFCSSTYGLTWYFLSRIPGLMVNAQGQRPVWNAAVWKILGVEIALVPLLLGITFFVQSRKRDFI
jgi:ABC-2 type transport system permease protein